MGERREPREERFGGIVKMEKRASVEEKKGAGARIRGKKCGRKESRLTRERFKREMAKENGKDEREGKRGKR